MKMMKIIKDSNKESKKEEPLQLEMVRLEAIAETMQEQLYEQNLVQDREYRSHSVPQAFTGKDAVSILLAVLELECSEDDPTSETPVRVTRDQALQVGIDIANEFQFFSHAKNTTKETFPLEDTEKDIYRFQNNLPLQVHTARTKYPSNKDKIRLLEQRVARVGPKPECFVAKDAVDVLMRYKLVRARHHAVQLIQKLNEKAGFCKLAKSAPGKGFADNDKTWRFVGDMDRAQSPRRKTSRSPTRKSSSKSLKALRTGSTKSLKSSTGSLNSQASRGSACSLNTAATGQSNATFDSNKSPGRKDKAYFKDRAREIRNQLNEYRDQRSDRQLAAACNSSFAQLDI